MHHTPSILKGSGRAVAGALLFALPLFLTMEVWRLAVSIPDLRLALLLVVTIGITVILSRYLGFRSSSTGRWRDATIDAVVALLVGVLTAGLILWVLSVIKPTDSWRNARVDRGVGGPCRPG
jgi:uncharacterized membrane protein